MLPCIVLQSPGQNGFPWLKALEETLPGSGPDFIIDKECPHQLYEKGV
ncbi:hypothetical protein SAMN05192553_101520 [Cyclobacterium xiamenense]|uniref:Uncharacterized protein n=1 Tax=Cyclobacterium xiamenense TaxID=1297121 RepID=A0A1H6U8X9_9BACT|nr:hypothetical protein SAMN05192553_101520 [Cyclobacterium xiamenense]